MKKKSESQTETMVKPCPPRLTVKCVDTYCKLYRDLFIEVRAYEAFKDLHVGIISDIKRKSLPASALATGLQNEQGLLHFLTESPCKAEELEKRRLEILRKQNRLCEEIIYWKFGKNRK